MQDRVGLAVFSLDVNSKRFGTSHRLQMYIQLYGYKKIFSFHKHVT